MGRETMPKHGKSGKRAGVALLAGVLVAIAAVVAAAIVLHGRNERRLGMEEFRRAADEQLDRLDGLIERAEGFDQERALAELGPNVKSGFVFRFDDAHEAAHQEFAEEEAGVGFGRETAAADLLFEGDDPYEVGAHRAQTRLEDGILVVETEEAARLEAVEAIDLPAEEVEAVELRMRVEAGPYVDLIVDASSGQGASTRESHRINVIDDGDFHTYRVKLKTPVEAVAERRYQSWRLGLGGLPPSRVEIASVRFVARDETYRLTRVGMSEETKGQVLRRPMYMRAPGRLVYEIELPEEERLTLSGGIGVLRGSPVRFSVEVEAAQGERSGTGGEARRVVDREWADAARWGEIGADLTAWAGRKVRVTLGVESEGANVGFWADPAIHGPPREPLNVVIVLEDTLRADRTSLFGNERATTPYKDELTKEGVAFELALAQATQTRPSCPTILTSLHGTATGVWSQVTHDTLAESYLTLPEIMRAQGFATGFLCLNVNGGPAANLQQGFEEVHLPWRFTQKRARAVYEEGAKPWIEAHRDRNFFLLIHLLDPHGIYDPPVEFREWVGQETDEHAAETESAAGDEGGDAEDGGRVLDANGSYDPPWDARPTRRSRVARYDGEIAYNDREFGRFWDWMRAEGLAENTLLIFLSDHGEYLGERGLWGHSVSPDYLEVTQVPLMMVYPKKLAGGRRVSEAVQLIDVMPTVLEIAGIETGPLMLSGDSLASLMEGGGGRDGELGSRIVVTEDLISRSHLLEETWATVTFGGWRALHSKDFVPGGGKGAAARLPDYLGMRVYDLESDPEERRRLSRWSVDPLVQREFSAYLEEFRALNTTIHEVMAEAGESGPTEIDSEAIDQLRDLGYLE